MDEDYETVTVVLKMEVRPGTDMAAVAADLVTAAERDSNVLAAWEA